MSEMVERVGEALRVKLIEWYAGGIGFEDGGLMLARAAIEAMKMPTVDMCGIGANCGAEDYTGAHNCWKAMIQAALGNG